MVAYAKYIVILNITMIYGAYYIIIYLLIYDSEPEPYDNEQEP